MAFVSLSSPPAENKKPLFDILPPPKDDVVDFLWGVHPRTGYIVAGPWYAWNLRVRWIERTQKPRKLQRDRVTFKCVSEDKNKVEYVEAPLDVLPTKWGEYGGFHYKTDLDPNTL